jgi:sodium transport system permease protein
MDSPLFELYRHELRMVLRDRRTILFSILLPLLVMPVFLFTSSRLERARQKDLLLAEYSFSVTGSQARYARSLVEAARTDLPKQTAAPRFRYKEVREGEFEKSLDRGDIDFYLRGLTPEEAVKSAPLKKKRSEERSPQVGEQEPRGKLGVPVIDIYFRADREASRFGSNRMREMLENLRQERRSALLKARGFELPASRIAEVEARDVATPEQVGGAHVGRFLTLFIMFFLFTGGAAFAIDSLAGEKERGTLETLLTTSVRRSEIIVAKLATVLSLAFLTTLLQVGNLLVYLGFGLVELPKSLAISFSAPAAALVLALYLPVIALVAGVLLLTSGYAKTYKEAQLYFLPVFLVGLLPAVAPFLPGLKLRSAIVLVPVGNISLAVKEILVGRYDWTMIAVSWLITAGAALYIGWLATRSLSVERLITAGDIEAGDIRGGPSLFPRHVLRWFAVMWVLIMAAAVNVPGLSTLRPQILFNVAGVFLGGSLLLVWRYRLNPREALALRAPRLAVWPAVLVGAPAAFLTSIGVLKLASLLLPVPPNLLEEFSRTLLPKGLAVWQLYLFVAVIPGVGEEVAFRGLLLHGLRRRFHPVVLALIVGGVFGFFHAALFRLIPTAFLGAILTTIVMLTGSIFPAMLFHGLVNATAISLGLFGAESYEPHRSHLLGATVVLAASLWLIWLNRTPYPELRGWKHPRQR